MEKLYTTKKSVSEFQNRYIKKHKKSPRLPETLMLMKDEGLLSSKPLSIPHIDGLMSLEDFREAFNMIPFEANGIIHGESYTRVVEENGIFPADRDAFCIQHLHNFGIGEMHVDHFFSVTCIFEGKCSLRFQDEKLLLDKGDILIIAPGSKYVFSPDSDAFAYEAIIRSSSFTLMFGELFTINTVLADFFRDSLISKYSENYLLIRTGQLDDELTNYIKSFTAECISDDEYSNACAVSLIKLFLIRSFRKYRNNITLYHHDSSNTRPDIKMIREYIQNNYRDVTLSTTADFFHYNKTYISRLIHSHYNKSFSRIVTEIKISNAKEYLKRTNKQISEIAFLVGYDSADHFSRTFKKEEGISPAFYRSRYKNENKIERPESFT